MKPIVVIAGLTASGKTKAAIELAKEWNAEIISADSVAVYKGLDIGSAKPSIGEQDNIKHHMIDIVDYKDTYNVARFQEDARETIKEIQSRDMNVIVVGGTGLYIKALLYDYRFSKEEQSEYTRDENTEVLYKELESVDPSALETIHPNNRKRIIRALESYYNSNKTRDDITENRKDVEIIPAHVFFLQGDRERIYDRINKRVEIMFDSGLEKEVLNFYEKDPDIFKYPVFQSIGYREFQGYFNTDIDKKTCISLIQRNTRRFAKRQITWFKHQQKCIWIDIFEENVLKTIKKTLEI
ncbi:MAG: tRNA (adenosine(37)-N6)-dimethylallyltransferase MiaA [Erysipelothrix sp.]|nr:tRNA (adenosine(37)-N6)-dimethylallyltransferase MiaA [Erysipelothrix sp.]